MGGGGGGGGGHTGMVLVTGLSTMSVSQPENTHVSLRVFSTTLSVCLCVSVSLSCCTGTPPFFSVTDGL